MIAIGENLNYAQNWQVLEARTPQALVAMIAEIHTPIAVKFIFPYGNRVFAIIGGDVRIKRTTRKEKSNGSEISGGD